MADYYTSGTVAPFLPLTEEIVEALGREVGQLDYDDVSEEITLPKEASPGLKRFYRWVKEYLDAGGWVDEGTHTHLTCEKSGEEGLYYLYFQEHFDDFTLTALQDILSEMPEETQYLAVEYADTCSKMRPGSHGGGAMIIHREGVEAMNTGAWIERTVAELTDSQKL